MKLFTEVPIPKPDFDITYQDSIFCLGSCFANEIGHKLQMNKFKTYVNPFGTQFHPLALETVFSRIFSRSYYTENEIFHYKDLYFSWDHGAQFSTSHLKDAIRKTNTSIEEAHNFLSKSQIFIFTLGTAWAYFLKDGHFYVSNCHKVPQKMFEKHLLKKNQILASLRNLILMTKDMNAHAKIVFTISPVRHTRDGFRENNVSKGILHKALNNILQEFTDIHYFPAYEIVLDELRDYRYFADDLVHVNSLGVQYIWDKFSANYFSEETIQKIDEIQKIQQALAHSPVNPKSIAHKKFLYQTIKKAEILALKLPKNTLQQEIQELKNSMHAH